MTAKVELRQGRFHPFLDVSQKVCRTAIQVNPLPAFAAVTIEVKRGCPTIKLTCSIFVLDTALNLG
jgi:hypothetical protein